MSDIFISYKREEQATARQIADALEKEGWSVWWDPKLRAGDDFDKIIEAVLNESRCVIVLWSELSIQSDYVRAEASEALEKKKLVPVAIENVTLPFRFKRLHTPRLLNWDGSSESAEFRKLVDDIAEIIGSPKRNRETRRTRSRPSITIDNLKPGKGGATRLPSVEPPTGKLNPGTVFRRQTERRSQGPDTGSREAEEHQDGLGELVEALRITRTAFRVQVTRRDQLVKQMQRRLRIKGTIEYDEFFRRFFKKMTVDEKALFDWIRAITKDQMKEGNAKALAVLERHRQLLVHYPRLVELQQHLRVWLNKYDRIFSRHKDMCVLYVGFGDGVGYPRGLHAEMEEALTNARGKGSA